MNTRNSTFFVFLLSLILSACSGGGGGGNNGLTGPTSIDRWTWMSGSDTYAGGQSGTYGSIGVADAANVPGARQGAMTWTDAKGDFWLFGGWGYDSAGTYDRLNDLWRWDGTNWTWISGSDTGGSSGTYGIKGTPDAANVPSARNDAVSWIDSNGDFWLFGGYGYDGGGSLGYLNDLWRWDTTTEEWTWMSGSNTRNQNGTYGAIGVSAASNEPGSRRYSTGWIDASDNLWLFGGNGYGASGTTGQLSDLWFWDVTTEEWTWMSGSDTRNQAGSQYTGWKTGGSELD